MKLAVSISLGPPSRDYRVVVEPPGGPQVELIRLGTAGDIARAAGLIRHFDGRADAIGLGGVNLAYALGRRRWPIPAGVYLASQARRTPVVDGSGFKEAIEPDLVRELATEHGVDFRGATALVTSVLDRYPLARALAQHGARVLAGDPLFALRIPLALPLPAFEAAAVVTMPALRHLPLSFLYPHAERPAGRKARVSRWVSALVGRARVVAGDFHLLQRFGELDLSGKVVIASTVSDDDVARLLGRGAALVAAAVPALAGRSPAANAMDAVLVAWAGPSPSRPAPGEADDYCRGAWRALALRPRVDHGQPR